MLLEDRMVATANRVLDVSNLSVNPFAVRNICTVRPATCFDGNGDVSASRISDTRKAPQTIGGNYTAYELLGPA